MVAFRTVFLAIGAVAALGSAKAATLVGNDILNFALQLECLVRFQPFPCACIYLSILLLVGHHCQAPLSRIHGLARTRRLFRHGAPGPTIFSQLSLTMFSMVQEAEYYSYAGVFASSVLRTLCLVAGPVQHLAVLPAQLFYPARYVYGCAAAGATI